MGSKTKIMSVRLNWRHLQALERLKQRWDHITPNKIMTSCLMWRASETVEEFEALEAASRRQKDRIERLESVIRMILRDNWSTFIRDNKDVLGFLAKPDHTWDDYFHNQMESYRLYLPIDSKGKPHFERKPKYEVGL
jgi:hypothetical protein